MKFTARTKTQRGFTLIELLVVIGILAVLLAITLIAINPARQFGNANNTKRRSDTTQILSAVGQYTAENKGQLPPEVAALTADTATTLNNTNFPNLCALLIPEFIPAFPTNPTLNTDDVNESECAAYATGYSIARDANNRITVSADTTDNGAVISVTR
ncbi:MAG: type II secretion system protein [Candidatus Levybacteria bacterium]|nr:type II secretion system protein [Candidatus Levybacteria bacterium]